MEENILTPTDYFAILRRRKWTLILSFLLILFTAAVVALLLPSVYKSTSTILIEQREIPAEYVTTSMTTYAEQRIQSINQRVLTSSKLLDLIKQFDLYRELKKKKTQDEVIAEMREDIILEPVNIEIADRRSGRTGMATIAFTLSYEGETPRKVQQVANNITSLFLKEDLKVRKDQASTTHEFLKDEKERIQKQLVECENEIAVFKQKNAHSLPELFQVNVQTMNTIQRNIESKKEILRSLKEKKEELEEQLVNTPVDLESTVVQRQIKDEDELRLEALKMELINLKTKFSDMYPDVKKLTREIKELSVKVEQSKEKKKAEEEGRKDKVKNPAYVTLSARLAGMKSDVESVMNHIRDFEKEAGVYKVRLASTPVVEEKYNNLLMEKRSLTEKYNDLQAKMMEAKVAQELESKQKGERFSLIESARLPEKPFKPNRWAVVLLGAILGLGLGVGFVSIAEFSDTSFRDSESLLRATGFPVLTEVPVIITREDRIKNVIKRLVIMAAMASVMTIAVILFDRYVIDLEVLWAKIMRQISN